MEKVVIIGAGLGGLICGLELQARKIPFVILEAENEVGGRVRTEVVDGFALDLGFQILLSGYPWVQRYLDLAALKFAPVKSGAAIWDGAKFERLLDPIRHPSELSSALTTPVLSWGDRLRLTALAASVYPKSPEALLAESDPRSTAEFLAETKFSDRLMESFLRPFFGGVFLERELATASTYFLFLFRVFGTAPAGLTAGGLGAIPRQLAARLPADSIRLRTKVESREGKLLRLGTGEIIHARAVVCAGNQSESRGLGMSEIPERRWHSSVTIYFAAAEAPGEEKLLALNGSGRGIVNSVLNLSSVAEGYAPAGQHLISVSLRPNFPAESGADLSALAREELRDWYGAKVEHWRHLRTIRVPHGLPAFPAGSPAFGPVETAEEGVFVAGDARSIPSQEGAATSGRRAAEAVANYLSALSGAGR